MRPFIIACVLLLTSSMVAASDGNVIPLNINFVSTKWIDGAGTFRIIDLNDEFEPYDPCFLIQHFENGLRTGITNTIKICSVATEVGTIDARNDSSGGTWFENFTWEDTGLQFTLVSLDSMRGTFNCKIDLRKGSNYVANCNFR